MNDFYRNLTPVEDFEDVFRPDAFTRIPDDWWVIVLDIRGSTGLIEAGRYRDVNFVGASSIAAIRNAAGSTDLPFVFGGDGATVLIPESERPAVGRVLLGIALSARDAFDIELHIGMVQVGRLRTAGFDTLVARYRASPQYHQAIFEGSGIAEAERRVKNPAGVDVYRMHDLEGIDPDFSGVECRWKPIRSPHGETVSLLIEATTADEYRHLLERLDVLYGPDHVRHPALPGQLKASFNLKELSQREPRLRRKHGRRTLYTVRIWLQQFLLLLFIRFDMNVGGVTWRRYLPLLSETSDVRKFDGMLRMVLAGTPNQRRELESYLQQRLDAGALVWGLHVSDSAIMTCLVFERLGDQVHFIDGSSGGYAMAAADLKKRRGQAGSG